MLPKIQLVTAMLIWASIGIFVKNIDLSSLELAFFRAIIGGCFLMVIGMMLRKIHWNSAVKKALPRLMISGVALSINWIFLFQAYKYTTVSVSTLSYYFAPVFVIILSPIILKETLTIRKFGCVLVAMFGLCMVINTNDFAWNQGYDHTQGILYGLAAAMMYASIVLMNKFIKDVSGFDSTIIQLLSATIVLLGYIIFQGGFQATSISGTDWLLIAVLGVAHTGIAFWLFFSAIANLPGQTAALLSYIDPISAILFASLLLQESMTFWQICGAILVLGSTLVSEWLSYREVARCKSFT